MLTLLAFQKEKRIGERKREKKKEMADRLRYVIINDSIEKLYYQNVLL